MTRIHDLARQGQAIWLDYIRRSFLDAGGLQDYVDKGVRGVTSNPSIFEQAIAGSDDYDAAMRGLIESGMTVIEIYEALALDDIRQAADTLRPVYNQLNGGDGFVSMEVNPKLAHDTEATIAEARRLWAALERPNIMIKVPATPEGIPAITALIAGGINVNVTLMFSLAHYDAVAEAYIAGLEQRAADGGDLSHVNSVASFFISRVDTAVDAALQEKGNTELQGKIAVANGKAAYARYQETFSGPRWEALQTRVARPQRVLWASTGTKNPAYSDTLYVDQLIGPDTVNTAPTNTLEAFLEHGSAALTLTENVDEARAQLAALADLGLDLETITQELQAKGVAAFAKSFETLLGSIAAKQAALKADAT